MEEASIMNQIKGPLFDTEVLAKYNGTPLFNKKKQIRNENINHLLKVPFLLQVAFG